MTEEMEDRVRLLLDTNAVLPVEGWERRACIVHGRTGVYTVKAFADRVECTCIAGQNGVCSHSIAAMIVWGEMRA